MYKNRLIKSAKDDVVDGNKEELDDITDATHDGETDGARSGDLLELGYIGFLTDLKEALAVDGELLDSLDSTLDLLVHSNDYKLSTWILNI